MENKKSLFVILLLTCLFFVMFLLDFPKDYKIDNLYLEYENNIEIKAHQSEDNNIFFIPSGFDDKDYKLVNKDEQDVVFEQLNKVPTLYIKTSQKDLEFLNADKDNKLDISCLYIDSDGNVDSRYNYGTIKGRGNNSWITDKKSYNLNFNLDVEMLGMKKAKKWVLVPNSSDHTGIRNKLVYDFAKTLDYQWAISSEYVNIYINGEYIGLYLLCEKLEVDDNRLNLDKDDYLLKRELSERLSSMDNGFMSKYGNAIEIEYPKNISETLLEQIRDDVNLWESVIFYSNDIEEFIDVESWARTYLIDEVFDNLDAGIASAYFYKKDGLFYRGPIWDYDSIMFDNPESVVARSRYRHSYSRNDYYYHLNQNDKFIAEVNELFKKEFVSYINNDLNAYLTQLHNYIDDSLKCDSIRWDYQIDSEFDIEVYLKKRVAFLEKYFDNPQDYCIVQILDGYFYDTYVVEKGKTIDKAFNIDMNIFKQNDFYCPDTSQQFDISDVIENDIRLHIVNNNSIIEETIEYVSGFGLINTGVTLVFIISFGLLYWVLRKENEIS